MPTGKQLDSESGLAYYGARYYDPSTRNWLTRDPLPGTLRDPLTRNPYLFNRANPLRFIDPTGTHITGANGDCVSGWECASTSHNHSTGGGGGGWAAGGGFVSWCTTLPLGECGLLADAEQCATQIIDYYIEQGMPAEALAQLFEHPDLLRYATAGDDPESRLEFILRITQGTPEIPAPLPQPPGVQFGFDFGNTDADFAEYLQDGLYYQDLLLWQRDQPGTNQVGHFLTAVKAAYDPSFLDTSVYIGDPSGYSPPVQVFPARDLLGIPYDEDTVLAIVTLIIGHELLSDDPTLQQVQSWIPFIQPEFETYLDQTLRTFKAQYEAASPEDVDLFLEAVDLQSQGEEAAATENLVEIFTQGGYDPNDPECESASSDCTRLGMGNSLQDLQLTLLGYSFGSEIGDFETLEEVADRLREDLTE